MLWFPSRLKFRWEKWPYFKCGLVVIRSRLTSYVLQDSREHKLHCGPEQPRIQTEVLGHSLVHSLIRSHRSFVHLLCTDCFARVLHCAYLPHSLAHGTVNNWMAFFCFFLFWTIVNLRRRGNKKERGRAALKFDAESIYLHSMLGKTQVKRHKKIVEAWEKKFDS